MYVWKGDKKAQQEEPIAVQFQQFYFLLNSSSCRRHHKPLKQIKVFFNEIFHWLQRSNDLQIPYSEHGLNVSIFNMHLTISNISA